jgi:hypothetical protein
MPASAALSSRPAKRPLFGAVAAGTPPAVAEDSARLGMRYDDTAGFRSQRVHVRSSRSPIVAAGRRLVLAVRTGRQLLDPCDLFCYRALFAAITDVILHTTPTQDGVSVRADVQMHPCPAQPAWLLWAEFHRSTSPNLRPYTALR